MRAQNKDDYCGCCGLKERIKVMWDRLQTTIYGIKLNGTRLYPDGDGIVNIVISQEGIPIATDEAIGGVISSSDESKVSVDPLTGEMTANGLSDAIDAIEQSEAEIASLHETVGDDTGGLVKQVSNLEGDVAEIDQDIIDLTTAANRHEQSIQDIETALDGKQATLVSGTNIKTVNGSSILGSGDLGVGENLDYTKYTWSQVTTSPSGNPATLSLPANASALWFVVSTQTGANDPNLNVDIPADLSTGRILDISPMARMHTGQIRMYLIGGETGANPISIGLVRIRKETSGYTLLNGLATGVSLTIPLADIGSSSATQYSFHPKGEQVTSRTYRIFAGVKL